jgi:cell wall-associated NlpC family hydrolase
MIEPQSRAALSSIQQELDTLKERAKYQRRRQRQFNQFIRDVGDFVTSFFSSPVRTLHRLPGRYILHVIVALIVPLALALTYLPALPVAEPVAPEQPRAFSDTPAELGPLSLGQDATTGQRIGDPPLPETDALPMPISLDARREALAPVVVPATVAFDRVRIRNGPGLDYDNVGTLSADTELEVVGRYGEWLQVRRSKTGNLYWVAGELLDFPEAALYTLFEVPAEDIPPPPPPKIGTVRESNLNLRDGPGTHYVSMEALDAGVSLALIEKYQDWVHVATNDFDGWVKSSFLDVEKSIMQRVPETEYIPDPNPALVGSVVDDMVNLREGPGKVYHTLGNVNADATVDLLARHGDWFKVQLRDGTVAWIFSDLLYISPMARRRVPYTNDIPAEPAPVVVQVARNSSSSGGGGGGYTTSYESSPSVNTAVSIPASGDVASYAAQFVGYPYVYGGASPGSGFDCSGLVQYVYRQYGVYLPRVAAAQYSTAYGAAVGSMSNLAPGDLMFFAGTAGPGISHVAIYIGGGSMVHAMTPGLGVGVSNIWEGYWVSHYYGAIRPYR